jgi:hypothetical protein
MKELNMRELKIKHKKAELKIGKTIIPITIQIIRFKRGEIYELDTLLHPYDIFNVICDDDDKELISQPNFGIPCILPSGEKINDILWHMENVGVTEEILQICDKMSDTHKFNDGDSVLIHKDFTINLIDNTTLTKD